MKEYLKKWLRFIGEDPEREGLKDTPQRMMDSWKELYGGYKEDPKDLFVVWEEGKDSSLVLLKNISFASTCEHHCMPFFGKAHIAYIPNGRVIGISKLARLLKIYTRRLQIQERIGEQVVGDLMKYLKPKGAACILEATHLCMKGRGVKIENASMITSALGGCFLEDFACRQELMILINGGK